MPIARRVGLEVDPGPNENPGDWLTICPPASWDMSWEDFVAGTCHAMFGFEKPRWHYIPEFGALLPDTVQLEWGYILTGRDVVRDGSHPSRWPLDRAPLPLETSVPGVFAVGDARYRSIKRSISRCKRWRPWRTHTHGTSCTATSSPQTSS